MSERNDQENKKAIGGIIAVIVVLLLNATGGALLPILIIAGIAYAIIVYIKKQSEEQGISMSETVKKKSAEVMNRLDEIEESGRIPTVSDLFSDARRKQFRDANASADSARQHMESKFETARRRQKSSTDGETLFSMLSRSEQTHYESFSSDFHDEYTHRSNELKDLHRAGIIDSAEYKDRMAMLKAEFKK